MKKKTRIIPPTLVLEVKSNYDKYKEIDKTNASARLYIQTLAGECNGYTVQSIAKALSICRNTVYSAVRRPSQRLGNQSTRPKTSPRQTNIETETLVLELRSLSNFGSLRISHELHRSHGFQLHHNTIARIFKRNRVVKRRRIKAANQEYVDYYKSPFSFIEIDTKEVLDLKALPRSVYDHAVKYNLPVYQFTAIDTFTRYRMLSYGYANTFTNAWGFINYVLAYLDSVGVPRSQHITIQTDNGSEYGGWQGKKLESLNEELKDIRPNTMWIHIPKLQKQKQGHVERSHKTDDEEFYIPCLDKSKDENEFIHHSQQWINYYNNDRPHQGKKIFSMSPIEYITKLREQDLLPKSINIDLLKHTSVLLMDKVSVNITEMITRAKARVRKEKIEFVQQVCGEYRSLLTNQ